MRNLLMYGEDNYYKVPGEVSRIIIIVAVGKKIPGMTFGLEEYALFLQPRVRRNLSRKRNGIAGELNGLKERLTIVIQHSLSLFHGHGPELLLVPSLDLWTLLRILSIVCPVSK
jgi:hypothetical protein